MLHVSENASPFRTGRRAHVALKLWIGIGPHGTVIGEIADPHSEGNVRNKRWRTGERDLRKDLGKEPGHNHYLSWLCAYELCVRHADESPAPSLINLDPTKIPSVDRKGIGDRLKYRPGSLSLRPTPLDVIVFGREPDRNISMTSLCLRAQTRAP
jgi:hypothetical protein